MGKNPHEPDTQQPLLIAEQQHREPCKQEMNINYEAPTAETTQRSAPVGPSRFSPALESRAPKAKTVSPVLTAVVTRATQHPAEPPIALHLPEKRHLRRFFARRAVVAT